MKKNAHRWQRKSCLLLLLMAMSKSGFGVTGMSPGIATVKTVAWTITGRVVTKSGEALPGVTIMVKGTNLGTATDVDGKFSLSVPETAGTLVASFVGYTTKEMPFTGPGTYTITIGEDAKALEELVVIGYGTQKKEDLSGAVAAVSSKDFQQGNVTTPEQLITGKVAGVQISSNGGQPGSGSTIRIRGGASLSATNDPLYVVDGVPLNPNRKADGTLGIAGSSNPLSLINPNDIETMTILKDASATAIYGSRASNGVILITTKKGKSGKPTLNFNSQFITSSINKKVEVLSSGNIRDYVNENGNATQKALLGTTNTNWQNEIYQTAIGTDNNLSLTGSFKNMPYRLSAGYLNQEGVLKTDKFERTSAAISLTPQLLDNHLKVDVNLKGSVTNSRFANQGAIGAAVSFDPTQPVYSQNQFGGYTEWVTKDKDGNIVPNPNAPRNPVALLMQKNDQSQVHRSFGNAQFDYKFHFLPDLHANLNLGYDVAQGKGTINVPAEAAQSFQVNPSLSGLNNKYQQGIFNKVFEFYLNYTKELPAFKSNINVTTGYGFYDNRSKNFNFANYSASGEIQPGTNPVFPYDIPQNRLKSYYGRLIYTLKNKYTFTGTVRTDGSSRFAPDNRWGVFPSASFAWRVNEEQFLSGINSLSDLKFRLSYGITGQQEIGNNYSYLANYNTSTESSRYQLGNTFYYMYAPAAYDANIKWEETATANLGLDYGFFNNRINGSFDIYKKKTKDLLSIISIPVGSNFSNQILTNVGNIENRGLEFSLNVVPVQKEDINWSVGFNLTANENKITKLTAAEDASFVGNEVGGISGATGQNIQIHSVGYTPYSFYVYKQVYNENGSPIEGTYEDLNGDGIINDSDRYRYKAAAPRLTLGFNTQLDYKKWNVSTILRAYLGNYLYNNVSSNLGVERNILSPSGIINNSSTSIYQTNFFNNQYQSDYYIENGSFLRMDNLTLGYNAGKVFKAANLRVSLTGQNLFTITKYSGVDPEISSGIDNNFYLRPRTLVVGLNLGF